MSGQTDCPKCAEPNTQRIEWERAVLRQFLNYVPADALTVDVINALATSMLAVRAELAAVACDVTIAEAYGRRNR